MRSSCVADEPARSSPPVASTMPALSAMAARSATERSASTPPCSGPRWCSVSSSRDCCSMRSCKFRRRSDADDPPQFHGNTRLEIAWTLVPLATFLSLFGLTAANMPFINNTHAGTQYTVTVIGQQFSWTFDYGTSTQRCARPQLRHAVPAREHRCRAQHRVHGSAVQCEARRSRREARSRRSSPTRDAASTTASSLPRSASR